MLNPEVPLRPSLRSGLRGRLGRRRGRARPGLPGGIGAFTKARITMGLPGVAMAAS